MSTRHRTEMLKAVPPHLLPYVAEQDPSLYTAIDHASWRFIMKLSQSFFAQHAHPKYLDGLEETGISTERIPLIQEMDQKLQKFGWRAVPVIGFIPPAVFMEFLSLGILPIACEMRTLEHLAYTPAPDIVHEAAGHAPIIADPGYAAYLHRYGELARKVIFSDKDILVYEAVRNLSDTKENPASTPKQIQDVQEHLDSAIADNEYVSEATYLGRMGWWTIEYGMVGNPENPMIFGAGLLSSIGESFHCMDEQVKKIPITLDAINMSYDITRPQPQLFLTPDFETLGKILEQFAETLAYKRGGIEGLAKARTAGTVTTTQLDSGVQISGILEEFLLDPKGLPSYLRFRGPVQLAESDTEIEWQGPKRHAHGFSTPLGRLVGGKSTADLSKEELEKTTLLKFESGIEVRGKFHSSQQKKGKNLVITFSDCTMKKGERVMYKPEWGPFDMVCGERIDSVFGGAADRAKYLEATGGFGQSPRPMKSNLTRENHSLNDLYAHVRTLRESGTRGAQTADALQEIHAQLEKSHRKDWLLRYELLELNQKLGLKAGWESAIRERLKEISKISSDRAEMIQRGLGVL